jgi:hypothetical protein
MEDDTGIIDEMVHRVSEDNEFRKRQFLLGSVAVLIKKLGVFNLIKWFPNFIPYMKLSFTKH